ncbi:RIP-like protein [Prorops nasuta]|uniref:RIP-like protein n=1 Tax=Prorops nasuta TaxID=863751 RepID=UPI0034CFBEB5
MEDVSVYNNCDKTADTSKIAEKFKRNKSTKELTDKCKKNMLSNWIHRRSCLHEQFRKRITINKDVNATKILLDEALIDELQTEFGLEMEGATFQLEWEEELFDKFLEDFKKIMCPFCQQKYLEIHDNTYVCGGCPFKLVKHLDEEEFKRSLDTAVDNHSSNCTAVPSFTIVQEKLSTNNDAAEDLFHRHLYMTCGKCCRISFIL